MIRGVGVDIVDIRRFGRVMERYGERFLARLFTDGERAYCDVKLRSACHYAARFAAKEAVIKVVGRGVTFRDIEVLREADGKPLLQVRGFEDGCRWHLSLSHDGDYSVAYVTMEDDSEAR
ncbi:MAG: holo-ACP synthase [Thermodesulfobacteriota bacterium]